jgi:O-antigen biosynthesis protein WbqP
VKRIFDFLCALLLTILFFPVIILVAVLIKLSDPGPSLYWSKRVGKNNKIFWMPKFRSMRMDTPQVATHLLTDSKSYLIPIGDFIRKTSLDELPQLFSILKGDMSFVGPRPALYNQDDLITQRTENQVHEIIPGLTGWAQINGRDEISIEEKVKLDTHYLKNRSLYFDIKIIFLTAFKVLFRKDISH